jgi:hypothetical protein
MTREHVIGRHRSLPIENLILDYKPLLSFLKDQKTSERADLKPVVDTLSRFIDEASKGNKLIHRAEEDNIFTGDTWAIESFVLFQDINKRSVNLKFYEVAGSLETVLALHSGESVVIPQNGLENTIAFIQGLAEYAEKTIPRNFLDPCNTSDRC